MRVPPRVVSTGGVSNQERVDLESLAEPRFVVYGLWCICHPSAGVRYVGQTSKTALARLKGHVATSRYGTNYPVYAWMRKHGEDNIYYAVLDSFLDGDFDGMNQAEARWISEYGEALLNLRAGGRNSAMSDSTKQKISAKALGRGLPPGAIEKIRAANTGRAQSPEERRRKSAASRGQGNPATSLTDVKVRAIYATYRDSGLRQVEVGAMFGVSQVVVSAITSGKNWRHLGLEPLRKRTGQRAS